MIFARYLLGATLVASLAFAELGYADDPAGLLAKVASLEQRNTDLRQQVKQLEKTVGELSAKNTTLEKSVADAMKEALGTKLSSKIYEGHEYTNGDKVIYTVPENAYAEVQMKHLKLHKQKFHPNSYGNMRVGQNDFSAPPMVGQNGVSDSERRIRLVSGEKITIGVGYMIAGENDGFDYYFTLVEFHN